jgi:hypothetical protein
MGRAYLLFMVCKGELIILYCSSLILLGRVDLESAFGQWDCYKKNHEWIDHDDKKVISSSQTTMRMWVYINKHEVTTLSFGRPKIKSNLIRNSLDGETHQLFAWRNTPLKALIHIKDLGY